MKFFQLFVDESGTSNPTHAPSPLYILCGCCIEKSKKTELREYANQIKFKYWGKTDVVWHSDSLRRNIDDFKIFRGKPRLRDDFLNDLFRFLNGCQAKVFVVVVDKARARARGWDQTKVVEESSATLVGHFTRVLLALNAKGKMFVESSDEDLFYLKAFNYFIGPHSAPPGEDYQKVRRSFTSLSFVTKHNHDAEEQVADLFAYAARVKYQGVVPAPGSYDARILNALNAKLWSTTSRRALYRRIDPFCVLPS